MLRLSLVMVCCLGLSFAACGDSATASDGGGGGGGSSSTGGGTGGGSGGGSGSTDGGSGGDGGSMPVRTLMVSTLGNGTGTIASSPSGIDCGATCAADFADGTSVTLTATPGIGSTFNSWGGACSATALSCTVTLSQAQSVTATFDLTSEVLTVSKTGSGAGAVTSTPAGIDCGATCSASYDHGTQVTLTAAASSGSTFGGWGGACSGTGACTVLVTAATNVSAIFTLNNGTAQVLTVSTLGNGTGAITSTPSGITCGATCATTFPDGTAVTLAAAAGIGSTFAGWGGDCTGTGACTVTLSATHTVTATFALNTYALAVTKTGNGTGTVTANTGAIDCGATCSDSFSHGTQVTLTAAPTTGSSFTGWSGACSGTGVCTVTVTAATSVTANFTLTKQTLAVSGTGSGTGTITSSPSGISCGATCSAQYDYGTSITLTASPEGGSTFAGWGGACTGTGPCTVLLTAANTVTAAFALTNPNSKTLTVAKAGNGGGVVASSPVGINCGTSCVADFADNTSVTLTPAPNGGSTFTGWSGACTGTGACAVTMSQARNVTATFTLQTFALNVTKQGTGDGTVTASAGAINCGATCSATYNSNESITLTATPATSSDFSSWGGACSGSGACTVTMNQVQTVTANFALKSFALNVTKQGAGAGTVTSSPAGIACGAACSANFNYGLSITLTAAPAGGSTFSGWGGACTGVGTCTVSVTQVQNVTATFGVFSPTARTLSVAKTGNGLGTITSSPAGITCGATCAADFNDGTVVALTAAATTGSTFTGWSGACTGAGVCTVTMSQAQNVSATFVLQTFALSVTKQGSGTGTVTANTGVINCGATCSDTYSYGQSVTLTASPTIGSTFSSWGGACSGIGTCTVTVTAVTSVTANFTLPAPTMRTLTLSKMGNGLGTVTSSPAGITCGATCASDFTEGTPVTLIAAATTGSTFTGWGGACSGSGSCSVTMTQAQSVTASFTLQTFALTVTKTGSGTGTVTANSGAITCGATCSDTYNSDQSVTLTATPATGTSFTGWSNDCAGTGACTVTMSQARNVTANFTLQTFALTVTKTGAGSGTVTSSPAGITCGATCSASYNYNQAITLTANPAVGSVFSGWGGACSGTGTCTATVTAATSVTANFTIPAPTMHPLTVSKMGNGFGTITSAPAGINCGATCASDFSDGTQVTLTAAATAGSAFTSWGGACSGSGSCSVTMSQAQSVTATFTLQTFALNVTKPGTGAGTVTANTGAINCGATCSDTYNSGQSVTLTATPSTGSNFTGWSGDCTGTGTCIVTMSQVRNVAATFTLQTFLFTVTKTGVGTGTVTSSPAGINCGANCGTYYSYNQTITLTATPAVGSLFSGWSGPCSGTGTCTVTVTAAANVTASFALQTFALTVSKVGDGTGNVISNIGAINCGATCSGTYSSGQAVKLTATPSMFSSFTGWSGGGCSGIGICTVTVTQAQTVTATFNRVTFELSAYAYTNGGGTGTITSNPAGLNCFPTCLATFYAGDSVTLTANPAVGSHLQVWNGACAGTAQTCTVFMNQAWGVGATFVIDTNQLTVQVAGAGSGTVISTPAGIQCSSGTCTMGFVYPTSVTLIAVPQSPASTFQGWGGACSGTGPCTVPMTQAQSVTATFVVTPTYTLTVAIAGAGSAYGGVTGTGIACGTQGSVCTATLYKGTTLTLLASSAPAGAAAISGWSGGGCSGTGNCVVTLNANTAVTATFALKSYLLTVTRTGSGTVTASTGGLNCGSTCSASYNYGTSVTLTAAPAAGYLFSGWGSPCIGTGTCVVTMDQARTIAAPFVQAYALTVTKVGNGSGLVTGTSPSNIYCGSTCSVTLATGTSVTLTAARLGNSTFTGWSGACSGTGTCTVLMTQARNVIATFNDYGKITIYKGGAGAASSSVTSNPVGITCGTTCAATFISGTSVTLTATAGPGYKFSKWTDGCTGTAATCTLTTPGAAGNTNVSAQFDVL